MSVFARTPESYAAWQLVKLSSVLRPEKQIWAEYEEGKQELDLLFDDVQESPTLEKLQRFFKLSAELFTIAERSFGQTTKLQRLQDLCMADLQAAGIEDCPPCGEYQMPVEYEYEYIRQGQIFTALGQAELEGMHTEDQILLAAREIQNRRNREGAGAFVSDR